MLNNFRIFDPKIIWPKNGIISIFKFSDKSQDWLIPNKSNVAKNWPFPGEFQSSSEFLEDSRSDKILEYRTTN